MLFLETGGYDSPDEWERKIFPPSSHRGSRATDKKANGMLAAEPNEFSERRLHGLRVLQPDDDVCVDEKFDIVHR
jgi:hypothetical protein